MRYFEFFTMISLKFTAVMILIPIYCHCTEYAISFEKEIPRIGIIGGGIGGTSCAYFLQQLFENKSDITLFEKYEVGGRLRLIDLDGRKFESGGSVIHNRNQYMAQFSRLLGLGFRKPHASTLGIYNGEKFVFEESSWYFFTAVKLLWRYGLSMFYLFKDVKSMLKDFDRIYNLQEKEVAFTSVDSLLNSMNPDFTDMTEKTLLEILMEKGYSQKFIDELVQSIMMVNYGQNNNISGFAGYVSLAGADNSLWSVEGGNRRIPEGLLELSKANFKKAIVQEVLLLKDGRFTVSYQATPNDPIKKKNFDVVVLSAPLIKGKVNVRFTNFDTDFQEFERTYHQTVSTFVKGTLNPAYFNKVSVPDDILTCADNLIFNSISKNFPVDNDTSVDKKNVYKLFSQKVLEKDSLEKLFKDVDIVKNKVWLAYPHYKPPEAFVPFVLHPGLYYTNAIELAASAMEMSAVSAKNIALLIFNNWKKAAENFESHKPVLKDEL